MVLASRSKGVCGFDRDRNTLLLLVFVGVCEGRLLERIRSAGVKGFLGVSSQPDFTGRVVVG